MTEFVDVVLLHRPGDVPNREVVDAITSQVGVQVRLHTHVGYPEASDFNRWFTIARARNAMKNYGTSPWVMLVDDDVVLDRDCITNLLLQLKQNAHLGVVGADYSNDLGQANRQGHISLGATLWRRGVLSRLNFRATKRLCECWCAAHDLRHNGVGIDYCKTARAKHLKPARHNHEATIVNAGCVSPPLIDAISVAFNITFWLPCEQAATQSKS